jgi:hypothetical protein
MPKPTRICVYAFSTTALFFRALIDACDAAGDPVEWAVIQPQGDFRDVFADRLDPQMRCYLYDDLPATYAAGDPQLLRQALESGEGLVTALLKDKDGYRWLNKEEQLRRGAAMYGVYRAFLLRTRPDFVLFPDLEVVDGFVLMNLCKELGIGVLYFTAMRLLGASFFAEDPYEKVPPYIGPHTERDLEAARVAIGRFRERRSNEPASSYRPCIPAKPSLARRLFANTYLRMVRERLHVSEETPWMRIARNVRGPLQAFRRRRFAATSAAYFDLKTPADSWPDRYILYALQYTPESSINGLEPYYVDQLRVIDALLLSLPRGHRLVVKEHPAMVGVRPRAFYRDLRRRPGLTLAHPAADTRLLIDRASVVTTVTGTIGLESYLLGKPCMMFGRTFFSHLCYAAPPLRDLRPALERIVRDHVPATEAEKEVEVAGLLNVGADFLISDPWYNPTVMAAENVSAARAYLWHHLNRLGTTVPTVS